MPSPVRRRARPGSDRALSGKDARSSNMERRVLLAIVLPFLVLYAYQAVLVRLAPKPAVAPVSSTQTANAEKPVPPAAPAANPPPAVERAAPPAAEPLVADTTDREIRVETRDVIAVFTNRG